MLIRVMKPSAISHPVCSTDIHREGRVDNNGLYVTPGQTQPVCVKCGVGVCVGVNGEHSCITIAGPHWEVVVVGTCKS